MQIPSRSLFCYAALFLILTPLVSEEPSAVTLPETSSPRATLFGFLDDTQAAYELTQQAERSAWSPLEKTRLRIRILGYLDTSGLPEHVRRQTGLESAAALKEILDRIPLPKKNDVPDGESDLSHLTYWRIPGSELSLERQTEGPLQGSYLFSASTVAEALELHRAYKAFPLRTRGPETSPGILLWIRSTPKWAWVARGISYLPGWFFLEGWGHLVWQWAGLFLVMIGGALLMRVAQRIGSALLNSKKTVTRWRALFTLVFPVLAVVIPLGLQVILREGLVLSGPLLIVTDFLVGVLLLVSVMRLVWAIAQRIQALIIARTQEHHEGLDIQIIHLLTRVFSITAVIIVFLEGGKRLGIPLTTLVAGAGIGGFAIAMAAQDSLKNILGGIMLILDKPFAPGERINTLGFDGVVQHIGLRSTRLEGLNGHAISIPNESLAQAEIENISKRPFIRRILDLRIPLDTPPAKASELQRRLEKLLENHEGLVPDFPPRVFLHDLTQDSQLFRIIYWYGPPEYWPYIDYSKALNQKILECFEELNLPLCSALRLSSLDAGPIDPTEKTS